jgi:hypothetical protein
MREHGVRVVNMSWGTSPGEYEAALQLFAVEAKGHVATTLSERHRCRDHQRNAFVRGPEQKIEFSALRFDGVRVKLTQLLHVLSRTIQPRIDEERRLTSALGHEVAEPENRRSEHEVDEALLVGLQWCVP